MALALLTFGAGFPLYTLGLAKLRLSTAQPVFSASMFISTALIAALLFKESIGIAQLLGIGLILSGILVIAAR